MSVNIFGQEVRLVLGVDDGLLTARLFTIARVVCVVIARIYLILDLLL